LREALAGVGQRLLGEDRAGVIEDAHVVRAVPEVQANREGRGGGVHKAENGRALSRVTRSSLAFSFLLVGLFRSSCL
jgi:hypothetical protein